ncbi:phage tail tape measure protein [Formicincola oecophyllae]|uniref:Phage tail tape measure protein n=1 Tax=Formicincola oecophyllae TaxID=2558361 RepID=A0A4Y6UB59_9PROT|nr:phage tail tape measure protein [Formicincola oecophyllae]QDH13808.1 phage tail tape measure protein [Formicincola oecophyllae]
MSELRAQFELSLADHISGPLGKVLAQFNALDGQLARNVKSARNTNTALAGTTQAADAMAKAMAPAAANAARLDAMTRPLAGTLGEAGQALAGTAENTTRLSEAISPAAAQAQRLAEATQPLGRGLGAVAEVGSGAGRSLNSMASAGGGATSALRGVDEEASRTTALMERLKSAVVGVGEALRGGFAGAGRMAGAGLGSVGRGVGDFRGRLHGLHGAFDTAQNRGMGAAMAGFEIVEPARAAAEYQNNLAHIGIGLDYHGADNDKFVAGLGRQINRLARDTGQSSEQLVEAAGFFSREGYNKTRLDSVLPQVAKIATAYNANPEGTAKTAFAAQESLGIKDKDLKGALAAFAVAGKNADMEFSEMAQLLPQVAASAGAFGVKGRGGVNWLASQLAVVRKSTGTVGEAFTNMDQYIKALTGHSAQLAFKKLGVNALEVEDKARREGKNPLEVMTEIVRRLSKNGTDQHVMTTLFNNQQNHVAAVAILGHQDQEKAIRAKVANADGSVIDNDYATGRHTLKIQVQEFEDAGEQLLRIIGTDFAPVMQAMTEGLHKVAEGFEWLDDHLPGMSAGLLGGVGAVIAITGAVAALGAIAAPLAAGFALVASPVGLAVAGVVALGAALYAVYKYPAQVSAFLHRMTAAADSFLRSHLPGWLVSLGENMLMLVTPIGAIIKIAQTLAAYSGPITSFFSALWGGLKSLFSIHLPSWISSPLKWASHATGLDKAPSLWGEGSTQPGLATSPPKAIVPLPKITFPALMLPTLAVPPPPAPVVNIAAAPVVAPAVHHREGDQTHHNSVVNNHWPAPVLPQPLQVHHHGGDLINNHAGDHNNKSVVQNTWPAPVLPQPVQVHHQEGDRNHSSVVNNHWPAPALLPAPTTPPAPASVVRVMAPPFVPAVAPSPVVHHHEGNLTQHTINNHWPAPVLPQPLQMHHQEGDHITHHADNQTHTHVVNNTVWPAPVLPTIKLPRHPALPTPHQPRREAPQPLPMPVPVVIRQQGEPQRVKVETSLRVRADKGLVVTSPQGKRYGFEAIPVPDAGQMIGRP